MKHQALFSSKDKNKTLNCHLLQFLFGALRVNIKTVSSTLLLSSNKKNGYFGIFFGSNFNKSSKYVTKCLTC